MALSDDSATAGGVLLALTAGSVRSIPRSAGDATVHDSSLLHAVSNTTEGTRYSLVVFVGEARAREGDLMFDGISGATGEEEVRVLREVLGGQLERLQQAREDLGRLSNERGWSLAAAIERVAVRYGAPHLRPTAIKRQLEGGNERAEWSARTLVKLLREDLEREGGTTFP